MLKITFPWRIPSKKNSKRRTGRFLISSKEYIQREKNMAIILLNVTKISQYPVHISYVMYRPDKRKADGSNKIESVNDCLVKYWILEDDNRECIKSFDFVSMWVDKSNPRMDVFINIINDAVSTNN